MTTTAPATRPVTKATPNDDVLQPAEGAAATRRYQPVQDLVTKSDANRLGLLYRYEAQRLPWKRTLWDVHTHLNSVWATHLYFQAADTFGVDKVWTMCPLETAPAIREAFDQRVQFIAVPNYARRFEPGTFTDQWLRDIEGFAKLGAKVCKFWAAPRGRDFTPALRLDHPVRTEGMHLARELGMMFMFHVADPDTWFATKYADHRFYGHKMEHYEALEQRLEQFRDVTCIVAHMGGHPEDLDHLQELLNRHPNLYLDTSATKWQVRELSRDPEGLRAFCQRNPGRLLFGTDLVAVDSFDNFDHYASRFWALRTLFETDYDGLSPIVDPDLPLLDPSLPRTATPPLRGAALDAATLQSVYHDAAHRLLSWTLPPEEAAPTA